MSRDFEGDRDTTGNAASLSDVFERHPRPWAARPLTDDVCDVNDADGNWLLQIVNENARAEVIVEAVNTFGTCDRCATAEAERDAAQRMFDETCSLVLADLTAIDAGTYECTICGAGHDEDHRAGCRLISAKNALKEHAPHVGLADELIDRTRERDAALVRIAEVRERLLDVRDIEAAVTIPRETILAMLTPYLCGCCGRTFPSIAESHTPTGGNHPGVPDA